MIFDSLVNSTQYDKLNANLKKGFDFLKNNNLETLSLGKHEIDGDNVFAIVNEYDSKKENEGKLEAHRIYTDIQYIVKGEEKIGYCTLVNQQIDKDYNADSDLIFYKGDVQYVEMKKGDFAIFFTNDLHMPNISLNKETKVRKIVVKVKL